jgi:alcohol dehydrogenase (cytochrome c)
MTTGEKSRRRLGLIALSVIPAISLAGVVALPMLRWRAQVVLLRLTGQIPDIELRELLTYMRPGSEQNMARLAETRSPYAVIHNFKTSTGDVEAGRRLFANECASCHAADGRGGPGGPSLVGRKLKNGASDWAVYRTIRLGVPNTAMAPHPLPESDLWQIVSYYRTFDGAALAATPAPVRAASAVRYSELSAVREPAADWLTYSGSYNGERHSALTQIDPRNVSALGLRWMYQIDGPPVGIEATPLVRNGVMFLSMPPGRVMALDAATGKPMWTFDHQLTNSLGGEFGTPQNRGVALLDDKVFLGTVDARLIALSAATGKKLWETPITREPKVYFISSAPLAYRDLVVTGVGTRQVGQGFIVAYDANTGKERWRYTAIPGPGERGHDTWAGDSWRTGGAPTWLTGTYDPELDLLVWATGNPKPDYDGEKRRGDNLYSNSVLGLRGSTGELLWYFQFTPADEHDWDANQIPVLADMAMPTGVAKRILFANRNGFYYVLDRITGKYLNSAPFVQQTWTAGIDSTGRPMPIADSAKTRNGAMLYPGNGGATNWWAPTYDPALKLMIVPAIEMGMVYFTSAGSWPTQPGGQSLYTVIRALDPSSGKVVWEHRHEPRMDDPRTGGLMSTSTGLVFGGDSQEFFALDSRTGSPLWSVQTGGHIIAAPMTYEVDGDQFVAITAGRNVMAFALPQHKR